MAALVGVYVTGDLLVDLGRFLLCRIGLNCRHLWHLAWKKEGAIFLGPGVSGDRAVVVALLGLLGVLWWFNGCVFAGSLCFRYCHSAFGKNAASMESSKAFMFTLSWWRLAIMQLLMGSVWFLVLLIWLLFLLVVVRLLVASPEFLLLLRLLTLVEAA